MPFPLSSLRFQRPKYQLPPSFPHSAFLHSWERSLCSPHCSDPPKDSGAMEHIPFFLLLFLLRHSLCDAVCRDVEGIQGGEVVYPKIRTNGSVLEYRCPPNSYAHPVSWRVCQSSGKWSPLRNAFESAQRPSCINYTCTGYITFENGWHEPRQNKYSIGDTITFHCQPGHRLFGTARRTCLANGEWSGRTAVCDPEDSLCPWPGIPLGGHRKGRIFEPSKAVTFTCLQELVLRGSARRVCQNSGQWSGEEPRCEGRYAYDKVSSVVEHLDMEEITSHAQTGTNIYFVLHASGSIGVENLKTSWEFIIALMEQAARVSDKVWFAVVAFADSAQLVSALTDDQEDVERAWELVQNTNSFTWRGTNTGAALGQVLSLIQTEPSRTSTRKHLVVLITSGRHNVGPDPAGVSAQIQAAVPNPDQNLDIFALGVGVAHKDQMEQIATKKPGTQRSFYLQSYRDLGAYTQLVQGLGKGLSCGVRDVGRSRSIGRVFRGVQVKKQWPWQVYLKLEGKNQPNIMAGGSIIAPSWILTAAHNVWDAAAGRSMAPEQVSVVVGRTTVGKGSPSLPVGQIIVHEGYKGSLDFNFDFDIALLNLTRPLAFTPKIHAEMSRILELPAAGGEETCTYQGRILTGHGGDEEEREIRGIITGWGKTSTRPQGTSELQQAEVVIQSRPRCQQALTNFTSNMFCAIGEQGQDACQGDSGGPFVVKQNQRWIQVGIVSHGSTEACDGTSLGVYTSVPQLMGWITRNVPELGFQ
ncbi:complement factor B-like isoform X2 [Chrysemys picta bellii]|uniref:complement factor B-like isoform X2 n=1 Tax=Chrysemys picta bellii TaxID=8478 RepID=UPI0032B1041E